MPKATKAPDPDTPKLADFEKSMHELEQIVEAMESGDLKLEDSLARFERGVALVRDCQSALKQAELRIKVLTEDGTETELPDAPDND